MALIKASYSVLRGIAYAGQIADTSLYNIDGACVIDADADAPLPIGKLVSVKAVEPVEGHKVVGLAKAGEPVLGIAVMSHVYSPTGEYEQGVAANIMTHGRIWAIADASLTDAQAAYGGYVSFDDKGNVNPTGTLKTSYTFTGEVLPTVNGVKLVKVQLLQGAGVAPAAAAGG